MTPVPPATNTRMMAPFDCEFFAVETRWPAPV